MAVRPRRSAGVFPALLAAVIALLLTACGSLSTPAPRVADEHEYFVFDDGRQSQEMVIFALGLIGTGYRFGGRNPEAGLDCSGMVSYVVEQVSGQRLPHNAARIAALTRPIPLASLQAGDLVFFNTDNRKHSHMGIYMGDGKFVHAPSSRGRVRIEKLDHPYFRPRIDGARTLRAEG